MSNETPRTVPSASARAEAAAWVARLHGPHRTAEVESGFRRWMSEDPERALAFELLTDTWEKSARLRRRPLDEVHRGVRRGFQIRFWHAAFSMASIAALAVIVTVFLLRPDQLTTQVGELRTLTLDDGTRVFLNTDTRVVPDYDRASRRVELEKGEATFEVALDSRRPFIVSARGHEVRALGTTFVVRRDDGSFAVTLVEGKVSVSDKPWTAVNAAASRPLILEPGQRLTVSMHRLRDSASINRSSTIDRPSIPQITAWQRGQVSFDETMLADAVAEMNRYSTTRLVIDDPRTAAIRISGLFRAGEQDNFAQAIARTYRVGTARHDQVIVLTGHIARAQ